MGLRWDTDSVRVRQLQTLLTSDDAQKTNCNMLLFHTLRSEPRPGPVETWSCGDLVLRRPGPEETCSGRVQQCLWMELPGPVRRSSLSLIMSE